eukprot:1158369-Karenia_brevis.AAC.1
MVHVTAYAKDGARLTIEFIVAERNQAKESKPPWLENCIGSARVKEVGCLMPKKYLSKITQNTPYDIARVSRMASSLSYENLMAVTSLQPDC